MAFDRITPEQIGQGEIGTLIGTIATVPSHQRDIVKNMDIANTNANPVTVSVYFVPSGGSASASNVILPNVTIPGYGIFQWTGTQVIDEGSEIQGVSSSAGVGITISGGGCV